MSSGNSIKLKQTGLVPGRGNFFQSSKVSRYSQRSDRRPYGKAELLTGPEQELSSASARWIWLCCGGLRHSGNYFQSSNRWRYLRSCQARQGQRDKVQTEVRINQHWEQTDLSCGAQHKKNWQGAANWDLLLARNTAWWANLEVTFRMQNRWSQGAIQRTRQQICWRLLQPAAKIQPWCCVVVVTSQDGCREV